MIRQAAALATALGALVIGEARARAGSCSDGGGDGGSSDSGSSSSSDSGSSSSSSDYSSYDSSSSSTPVPACVESSDVLGRQLCSGFGDWAMPRVLPAITIEVGTSVRTFSMARYRFGGSVDHAEEGNYSYRLVGGDLGDSAGATAVGADLRILGGKRLYGGLELEIGGVAADESRMDVISTTAMEGATTRAEVRMHVGFGGVVGARVPVGPFSLGGELFAGVRAVTLEVQSVYGACETTESDTDAMLAIEPRAKIDYFLSPWISLGAYAGTDLLARETRTFGVYLGGHVRAFDGAR